MILGRARARSTIVYCTFMAFNFISLVVVIVVLYNRLFYLSGLREMRICFPLRSSPNKFSLSFCCPKSRHSTPVFESSIHPSIHPIQSGAVSLSLSLSLPNTTHYKRSSLLLNEREEKLVVGVAESQNDPKATKLCLLRPSSPCLSLASPPRVLAASSVSLYPMNQPTTDSL